uniref:Thyroid peroxidase n=1 Tax=Anthurium amnicola TaxID=1678845 RepID=A0A1D1YQS5_9ARAE
MVLFRSLAVFFFVAFLSQPHSSHAQYDDGNGSDGGPSTIDEIPVWKCNGTALKQRTLDGTCNNLKFSNWGAVKRPFSRGDFEPNYAPNTNSTPWINIDVRMISNALASDGQLPNFVGNPVGDDVLSTTRKSMFEIFFGQFVNHDLEEDALDSGSAQTEIANVTGDPIFYNAQDNPWNANFVPYMSLSPSLGTIIDGKFHSFNRGNSFLDLSTIYGNAIDLNKKLRTMKDGLLLTKTYYGNGGAYNTNIKNVSLPDYPPSAFDTGVLPNLATPSIDDREAMISGDTRCSENIQLCLIHTIWIREHNYWAGVFKTKNPKLGDEELFQAARRWVIAEYQHVVFEEYLPAVVGFKLPPYKGYDPKLPPETTVNFATAAFRYGHSVVKPYTILDGCKDQPILLHPSYQFPNTNLNRFYFLGKSLPIPVDRHSYLDAGSLDYTPSRMLSLASGSEYGNGMDNIIVSLLRQRTAEFDIQITNALRNAPMVVDLYAFDIARGRLNGVPPYNEIRKKFNPAGDLYSYNECKAADAQDSIDCFKLITSNLTIAQNLQTLYGKVSKIDAIVGMFAEEKSPNVPLPPTITNILRNEFENKRAADRFWYEGDTYTQAEQDELRKVTMKEIIERNTNVFDVQVNPFKDPGPNDTIAKAKCSTTSNYVPAIPVLGSGSGGTSDGSDATGLDSKPRVS